MELSITVLEGMPAPEEEGLLQRNTLSLLGLISHNRSHCIGGMHTEACHMGALHLVHVMEERRNPCCLPYCGVGEAHSGDLYFCH